MKQARQGARFLQILIAALLVIAAGISLATTVLGPADEKTLEEHLGNVRSSASEAVLLIDHAREGHVTEPFLNVQWELLSKDLAGAAKALHEAKPPPGLARAFREAAALGTRASAAMERTPSSTVLSRAREELAAVRARALALEHDVRSQGS